MCVFDTDEEYPIFRVVAFFLKAKKKDTFGKILTPNKIIYVKVT